MRQHDLLRLISRHLEPSQPVTNCDQFIRVVRRAAFARSEDADSPKDGDSPWRADRCFGGEPEAPAEGFRRPQRARRWRGERACLRPPHPGSAGPLPAGGRGGNCAVMISHDSYLGTWSRRMDGGCRFSWKIILLEK